MTRLSVLLLLAACAEPLTAEMQKPAPGDLTLTSTPLVVGNRVTLSISGALPNQTMFLFRSAQMQANGFCPPQVAPDCMDLVAPVTNQFTIRSDANGEAELSFNFPNVPIPAVAMQIGYINAPTIDTSNAIMETIHQPTDDLDGDGFTAQEEIDGGSDPDDPASVPVTWTNDIEPLLAGACTPCHIGGASGGYSAASYADTVGPLDPQSGLAYIEPGDPAMSYTFLKITGDQGTVTGGGGSMMPIGAPLAQADIDLIEAWILAGAPE